jgi:hypothetical protein
MQLKAPLAFHTEDWENLTNGLPAYVHVVMHVAGMQKKDMHA